MRDNIIKTIKSESETENTWRKCVEALGIQQRKKWLLVYFNGESTPKNIV